MTNNTAQRPIWTVLVYMAADTGDSFYQYAMQDVTEMMKAPFDDRVRVVVHANAPSPWQKKCGEVTGASYVTGGGGAKLKMGAAKEIRRADGRPTQRHPRRHSRIQRCPGGQSDDGLWAPDDGAGRR